VTVPTPATLRKGELMRCKRLRDLIGRVREHLRGEIPRSPLDYERMELLKLIEEWSAWYRG